MIRPLMGDRKRKAKTASIAFISLAGSLITLACLIVTWPTNGFALIYGATGTLDIATFGNFLTDHP